MSNYPFNTYGGTQWYYYPASTATADTITVAPNAGGYFYVPVQPVAQPSVPMSPVPTPTPLSIPDILPDLAAHHGISLQDETLKQIQAGEDKKFVEGLITDTLKKQELKDYFVVESKEDKQMIEQGPKDIAIKIDDKIIGTVSVADKTVSGLGSEILLNEPTPGKPKYEKELKLSDEFDGPQMFVQDGYASFKPVSVDGYGSLKSISLDGYLSLSKTAPRVGQRWMFENKSYKIVFEIDKVNTQTITVIALQSIRNTKPQYAAYENGKQVIVPQGAFATSDWTYLEGQDRPNV